MNDYHLYNKTELRIEQLVLAGANLTDVATAVADTLRLKRDRVLVVDVRGDTVTLDILQHSIDPTNVVGKRDELLQRLSRLPGIDVTDKTSVSSDGMLGWIDFHQQAQTIETLKRSEKMAEEVRQKLSRRAIVYSTGSEVLKGQIKDTNTPTITRKLEADGYSVTPGPTLADDRLLIAGTLRQAIFDNGYSLVITTGGVGAEDKDFTVEAVLELDPDASTPFITKYKIGTGRHHKEGVRIAVGLVDGAMVVALPGPNDEVKASMDILTRGLKYRLSKNELAEGIAENLRAILRDKITGWNHGP